MITSYLRSAFRNVFSQRIYAPMNIIGLAIGLAGSLAVLLWVFSETGYDSFHDNGSRIQRVCRSRIRNGVRQWDGLSAAPAGPTLKEKYPGVVDYCTTYWDDLGLKFENESYLAAGLFVDPSFFDIFSFELEIGNPKTVLASPTSIVLTPETATRLFGDLNPIGQELENGLVVTGIVAAAPEQSSLEYEFLVTNDYMVQIGEMTRDAWYEFGYLTFLLMKDDAAAAEIAGSVEHLYKEFDPETSIGIQLQPLLDMHLNNVNGGGRIVYVYIFSLVAILLLVVACINFVNLATARATQRARELATRKVLGASRWQLGLQIMFESTIQTTIAMILAVGLLELSLPQLADFFGKELVLEATAEIVLLLVSVGLFTGLAAGAYPAFVLSSFRSAVSLRSRNSDSGRGSISMVRKGLVVFQFAVSAGLIFGALVIRAQMEHIQNADLGLDRDNIVSFATHGLDKDHEAFTNELAAQPGIEQVTAVFDPPAWCHYNFTDFEYDGKGDDGTVTSGVAWTDFNYVDVFGLTIIEGRNLSAEYSTDATDACLINEAAARAMGMDSPVGRWLNLEEGKRRTIVGVVKDFHFKSLRREIGPLIIGTNNSWFRQLCVKLSPEDIPGGLASVESTFRKFRPGDDFNLTFFEELLGRRYRMETRTSGIVTAFTIITTIVASFGLLGLAAASIERRTKEIGIRKVLGSSISSIVKLVTKEFLVLILIGNAVVAPLAYYVARRWLENFAYKVELSFSLFIFTTLLAVSVALLTISFKAIRAARANPVNSLKCE